MTAPVAFRATYADWKLIKTRGVIQVVMEVPLADSDAAYDVLGGMPNAANETWFGIAPISPVPAKENPAKAPAPTPKSAGAKRDWRDMLPAQQAGIRCEEPSFAVFLREEHSGDWRETTDTAECVRMICNVTSRAYLSTNQKARVIWYQLDSEYQAWLAKERVGA